MQTLELEKEVSALSPRRLASFRAHFADMAATVLRTNPPRLSTASWADSLAKEAAALPAKDIARLVKRLEAEVSALSSRILAFNKRAAALPLWAFADFRARWTALAKVAADDPEPARIYGEMYSLLDKFKEKEALSGAEKSAVADLKSDLWDEEIEEDAKSGALDFLEQEALEEYNSGKSKPLKSLCNPGRTAAGG